MAGPSSTNTMPQISFTLKLCIQTIGSRKRVLFAETEKPFIDILFSILTVPFATVIRMLKCKGHEMQGSLPNVFESLTNMKACYILPNVCKDDFLNPDLPIYTPSILPADKKLFRCSAFRRHKPPCPDDKTPSKNIIYVSDDTSVLCPTCCALLSKPMMYVKPTSTLQLESIKVVKEVVTYMVMDNLTVTPVTDVTAIELLTKFRIKDTTTLEERVVTFGMDEVLKLLQRSFRSDNVLTDHFC